MKKLLPFLLAAAMLLALAGCSGSSGSQASSAATATTSVSTKPSAPVTGKYAANVGFLKGPTGVSAAYLMDMNDKGSASLNYKFTLESDPSNITSEVINGSLDLAAVPTNVASVLYNKTKGAVKIVAVNTLSVLDILEKGDTVKSVSDLKGKTIHATGQGANPEYVLDYILRKNGLEPGKDVTIDFMDSTELATQMAAGNIAIAMLPVPNSTSVLMKNSNVRVAIDLGKEWTTATGGSSVLTQGCIVANMNTVNIDAIIKQFLADYEKSVGYMSDTANIDAASQLTAKYGIVGSADIAKAAIPQCNLTFITGKDKLKSSLSGYFDILYQADPTSVGGAVPDDNFYYGS